MRIYWMVLIGLLTLTGYSQELKVTAGSDGMLIGDHLLLTAEVNTGGLEFKKIDLKAIDTSAHFELINPGEAEVQAGQRKYIQKIVVTSFDSGVFYVPPLTAIFDDGNQTIQRESNPIPIHVNTVAPDSLGLAPLKDIIEEETSWRDYLHWILGALALVFVVLGVFWWRRRSQAKMVTQTIEVYIPPHEKALNELEKLERQKLWQKGETKAYEVQISTIFRRYIEEKFGFPALEWTTREIVSHLSRSQWEGISVPVVEEVLRQSDLVKYAKAKPGPEAHAKQMDLVRQWIFSTKNHMTEEE